MDGNTLWLIIGFITLSSPISICLLEKCIREPDHNNNNGNSNGNSNNDNNDGNNNSNYISNSNNAMFTILNTEDDNDDNE